MLSAYQDRGIIKWAAFDALNGFNSMLKEMKHRLGVTDKPILSDDDFESLDRTLQQAILENNEVAIAYYENGYSKTTFGKIKKLDYDYRMVVLHTREKIAASDIISIEIV